MLHSLWAEDASSRSLLFPGGRCNHISHHKGHIWSVKQNNKAVILHCPSNGFDTTRHQCITQKTLNICITFVQRGLNVFDAGPRLYKC